MLENFFAQINVLLRPRLGGRLWEEKFDGGGEAFSPCFFLVLCSGLPSFPSREGIVRNRGNREWGIEGRVLEWLPAFFRLRVTSYLPLSVDLMKLATSDLNCLRMSSLT